MKATACDKREVVSKQIGELVMSELQKLDKIACICFASVYKSFENVNEFQDAIATIGRERKGRKLHS